MHHGVGLLALRRLGSADPGCLVDDLDRPLGKAVQQVQAIAEAIAGLGHRLDGTVGEDAQLLLRRGGVGNRDQQGDVRPLGHLGPHPRTHMSLHASSLLRSAPHGTLRLCWDVIADIGL